VAGATMVAMGLAGALCGLAGTTLALGGATSYQVTPAIDSNVGFDAITVALLGRNSPWGTVWAGLLFGALHQGGARMQAEAGVAIPVDLVTILQAIIVIFVAAPRLTRAIFRLRNVGLSGIAGATTNLAVSVSSVRAARVPKHIVTGAIALVVSVLSLVVFGLGVRSKHEFVIQWSLPGARFDLGSNTISTRPFVLIVCAVAILAAGATLAGWLSRKWLSPIAVFAVMLSFIAWSLSGSGNGMNFVSLLQGTLFPSAIPLILGAMAGVIGERAGVVNVALEGQLLLGAFVGAAAATLGGSVWVGTIFGALAGLLVASILAVMAIRYLVDQVIIGVVLNLLVTGLTSFLFLKLMSPDPTTYNEPDYFHVWKIPGLGDIPIIGPVFFDGTIYLYGTYAIVAAVWYALFQTRWGLRLRSVGEHPRAADTVGIKVRRTRYRAVWLAGVIAGLGGASLVLGTGSSGTFSLNMTNGAGYIALAAVIFGKWTPRGAVLAALLFGFATQLASLLSQAQSPIDSNLLICLPYVVTIVAVAGFIGRVRPPAADGQPYTVG
jgi:general nucleoside transport system permease protein